MTVTAPYHPDDSRISAGVLAFLHSVLGAQLREEVRALLQRTAEPAVADVTRLRKNSPPEAVHAALAIAKVQARARQKCPELANGYIWAIPEALEQATDSAVARHKTGRFKAAGAVRIVDLCCGMGGDTLALHEIGPALAVDLSAARLACLRYNAESMGVAERIETVAADVAAVLARDFPPGTFFHMDPARRSGGQRLGRWEDLVPGPGVVAAAAEKCAGGAVKISAGMDFEGLPPGHLELISHHRSVVQGVLWMGEIGANLGLHLRTATMIENGAATSSYTGVPEAWPELAHELPSEGDILYEADGALTRAGLAAGLGRSLGLAALTSDGGYLLAASSSRSKHGALAAFRVLKASPFSEKRVITMLQAIAGDDEGPIEVKTRGKIPGVETDRLQVLFSKATPFRRTVLIYRRGREAVAVIAQRM